MILRKIAEYWHQQGLLHAITFLLSKFVDRTPVGTWLWLRNYVSNQQRLTHEPRLDLAQVDRQIAAVGINVLVLDADADEYHRYLDTAKYPDGYFRSGSELDRYFHDYGFQHFSSLKMVELNRNSVLLDVASYTSPFPQIVRQIYGCRVIRQDLVYAVGRDPDVIGGNACQLPIDGSTIDVITLHNSFHHFENDQDGDFVREAYRILKPGGKVVITPLTLSQMHYVLISAFILLGWLALDPGAQLIFQRRQSGRFERHYDVEALQNRVLDAAPFKAHVCRVTHSERIWDGMGIPYMLLLEKS